ncbi:AAA family ATPase, partial [Patescibacteria group bacterium AH-259-L07]|nr:AAA family ATPase [Patescibacteria group bacterium AH-259-L07]
LTGFKSFANPTILEFPKPGGNNFNITAIVGPNGSGKTNLGDGIRWALGEQSLKMLRGKKSHDIIFSGSKQKRHLNTAGVTLHFNNEDGAAPIEYKEFTITRRIYRNGESEYRINKSRTRLQDILILLARANFGQKSYSIIGQGMIDQILVSSPQERKKFFDEATGIKQYIYKRDKALKKIEKSKENLAQANIALSEIAPHLRSLARQINKLSQRYQIQEKLHALQQQYYGIRWHDLEQQITRIKKQCNTKITSQKQLEKEMDSYTKESRSLAYEKPDDSYQKLHQEHTSIIQKRDELFSTQSKLRVRLTFLEEKIKQSTGAMSLSINVEKLFTELKNIEQLQQSFTKQINAVSSIKKLNNLQKSAAAILKKIEHVISYFQTSAPKDYSDEQTIKNIQRDLQDIDPNIEQCNQELKQLNKELSHITYKEQDKRKKLLQWQTKIQNKQRELTNLTNSTNDLKIDIARLETKKESLEDEIKHETSMSAQKILSTYDKTSPKEIEYEAIQKLKHQLDLIGGIDPEVEKEYPTVKERYEFLHSQSTDLKKTLKSLNKVIGELNQKIKQGFATNFNKINTEFDRYFKTIFGGGSCKIVFQEASVTLPSSVIPQNKEEKGEGDDEEDAEPETAVAGIDIFATPPEKKIKSIEMLSGGEKALTSLALICAIISINKPPFVVLDEVDAALDQENSSRFAKILKELQKHSQFIIITHNQQTIEIADILYGVSMGKDGISKLISLKLEE